MCVVSLLPLVFFLRVCSVVLSLSVIVRYAMRPTIPCPAQPFRENDMGQQRLGWADTLLVATGTHTLRARI